MLCSSQKGRFSFKKLLCLLRSSCNNQPWMMSLQRSVTNCHWKRNCAAQWIFLRIHDRSRIYLRGGKRHHATTLTYSRKLQSDKSKIVNLNKVFTLLQAQLALPSWLGSSPSAYSSRNGSSPVDTTPRSRISPETCRLLGSTLLVRRGKVDLRPLAMAAISLGFRPSFQRCGERGSSLTWISSFGRGLGGWIRTNQRT